jgi:hypothetical protein
MLSPFSVDSEDGGRRFLRNNISYKTRIVSIVFGVQEIFL